MANCGCCIACMAQMCRERLCLWRCYVPDIGRLEQEQQRNVVPCSPNSQRSLHQLHFYSPVLGPHIAWHPCISRRCELLPLVTPWLLLRCILLGWFSEATPAQQCSCNTLLTERCLHKQERFQDICRKSFVTVFLFFLIMIIVFFFLIQEI